MTAAVTTGDPGPHPLVRSVVLHLAPGLLTVAIFGLLTGAVRDQGLPWQFALLLAFMVAGVPFQIAVLLFERRRLGWAATVPWRQRIERRDIWLVAGLIAWLVVVASVLPLVEPYLTGFVFAFLPDEFRTAVPEGSRSALIALAVLALVMNIAVPIVEELYFRGYLLPRLPQSRWRAVGHTALFSIYHFWAPLQLITRFVALLPMVIVVERRRSVMIGIVVHVAGNTTGSLTLLAVALAA